MEIQHEKKTGVPTQTFNDFNENPVYAKADVAMLGVACEITCTYGKGAWLGPQAFLDASFQLEPEVPHFHVPLNEKIKIHNLGIIETPREIPDEKKEHYWFPETKKITEEMMAKVKEKSLQALNDNKILMTIGGDHSITNGVLQALHEKYQAENVTIVHFDAHLDLRDAHEALGYSHASVMFNARKIGFPCIQIGIRDHISEEEAQLIRKNKWQKSIFWSPTQPRAFYEKQKAKLSTFLDTPSILSQIKTKYLYITLDMDVLDASLVPSTGTPLPHGMSFAQVSDLLYSIISHCKSQKISVLGFDITEIAPMLHDPGANTYEPKNVISPLVEMHAAQLAYKILFCQYLERFGKD